MINVVIVNLLISFLCIKDYFQWAGLLNEFIIPELILVWISLFMIQYLNMGFNWMMWLYKLIPHNKEDYVIGGMKDYHPSMHDYTHNIMDIPNLDLDIDLAQEHYTITIIIAVIIIIAWPSYIRYISNKLAIKYIPYYRKYIRLIARDLMWFKITVDHNPQYLTRYHRLQFITQSIQIMFHYILIQSLHQVVSETMFSILWFGIWSEYCFYVHMSLVCISVIDISSLGKRYSTFMDRMGAHFWSFYIDLAGHDHINSIYETTDILDIRNYAFGSLYWTFINPTNRKNLRKINVNSNSSSSSNGGTNGTMDSNDSSFSSSSNSWPIVYWPWSNYWYTHFYPTLYDIQTRYSQVKEKLLLDKNNCNNNNNIVNNEHVTVSPHDHHH